MSRDSFYSITWFIVVVWNWTKVSLRSACVLFWNTVMLSGAEVWEMTCPIANGPGCCAFFFRLHISFYWNMFATVVVPGPLLLGFLLSAHFTVLPSLLSIWAEKWTPSNSCSDCVGCGMSCWFSDLLMLFASAPCLTESRTSPSYVYCQNWELDLGRSRVYTESHSRSFGFHIPPPQPPAQPSHIFLRRSTNLEQLLFFF